MPLYTITRSERVAPADPRLRRYVNHDSRSRAFAYDTSGLTLVNTRHVRHVPVLDQGDLGSCTGNAGIGCLGTGRFFTDRGTHYSLDEAGAVALYSDATKADPYEGTYPPTDTGSDGLTVAKVLTKAGEIAGYRHTFTLNDALLALTKTPWICGTNWTDGMFAPDSDGRVRPTGAVAGGHEYVAEQLDVDHQRVWFTNSWGASWGVDGRFYMTWDDFGALLRRDGDVTIFAPLAQPTPTPTPVPPQPTPDPADAAYAAALGNFAAATAAWRAAKGL